MEEQRISAGSLTQVLRNFNFLCTSDSLDLRRFKGLDDIYVDLKD